MKIKTFEDGSMAIFDYEGNRAWAFHKSANLIQYAVGNEIYDKDNKFIGLRNVEQTEEDRYKSYRR